MESADFKPISATRREPFTEDELQYVLDRIRVRMLKGQGKFQGDFCERDLREEAIQELLDGAAYCLLGVIRVLRVLPKFEVVQ